MINVPNILKERITDKDRAYYNKTFGECQDHMCRYKLYIIHNTVIFDMIIDKKAKYRKLFRDKLSEIESLWKGE